MKRTSFMIIFCLLITSFAFVSVHGEPASASLLIAADKNTYYEGETVSLSFFVGCDSEIEGGLILLNEIDDAAALFDNDKSEIVFSDGVTISAEDEGGCSFSVTPAKVFDSKTALFTIKLKVKDDISADSTIDFKVCEGSYIVCGGVNIPASGNEIQITRENNTISAAVDIIGNLESVFGIAANLINKEDMSSSPLNFGEKQSGKIIIPETDIGAGVYILEITGDGFVKSSTEFTPKGKYTVSVNNFYPGDVDKNGHIDFDDFHTLCVYINDKLNVPEADLNRDKKIDTADVDCLIEGYKATRRAD